MSQKKKGNLMYFTNPSSLRSTEIYAAIAVASHTVSQKKRLFPRFFLAAAVFWDWTF